MYATMKFKEKSKYTIALPSYAVTKRMDVSTLTLKSTSIISLPFQSLHSSVNKF